jgi:hypothetical protein
MKGVFRLGDLGSRKDNKKQIVIEKNSLMGGREIVYFHYSWSQSRDDGKRNIVFQSIGPNIKLENGIVVFCVFRKTNCCL